MFEDYIRAFIMLFVTLDAIGNVPLFHSLTFEFPPKQRKDIITKSICFASIILIVFAFLGEIIFNYFGVTLSDFKIAGGIILFLVAIENILGIEVTKIRKEGDLVLVPLATPLLAGPAAISTVMYSFRVYGVFATLFSILLNAIVAWLILIESDLLVRRLGENGVNMLSKITSFILAGIAISMIRSGIQSIMSNAKQLPH